MKDLKPHLLLKHVLLDTCFIAKAYEYSDTEYFNDLFDIFQKYNCTPIINEFIKFEFLRGCRTKQQIDTKLSFLKQLSGFTLPTAPEILDEAVKISNIYSNKGIHHEGIGPIDCYITSFLRKHHKNLVFVTLNHKDFPLLLHDRFHIHSIDTKKEILSIGFYCFINDQFIKLLPDIS